MHVFCLYDCSESAKSVVDLCYRVQREGYPNIYGAKVPLIPRWDLEIFSQMLGPEYDDLAVLEFLKYGWPSNRLPTAPSPIMSKCNHASAINNPKYVSEYLDKEIARGSVIGPFLHPPFN